MIVNFKSSIDRLNYDPKSNLKNTPRINNVKNDVFILSSEKLSDAESIIKELSKKDSIQEFYSPIGKKSAKIIKITEQLKDPEIAKKVYSDKRFIKSSSTALIEIVDNQLKDSQSDEQKEQLLFTKGILEYGLSTLSNERTKEKAEVISYKNIKNQDVLNHIEKAIAFGSIFNFTTDSKSHSDKAEVIVNRHATAAAGFAGALAQTGIGDAIALTACTKQMCKKIFREYDRKGGYLAALSGVSVGFIAGTNLATTGLAVAPGAGNAVNAAVTYSLHQVTGRALIAFCENTEGDCLDDAEAVAKFGIHVKNGFHLIENEKVRAAASFVFDKVFDLLT